ncbi:MAG: N-6 DNA methylase [Dehalococcoidia bacterium]|nr:N-6 DNA methylase [Dehalococcoidia bacterium]
MNRGKLPKIPEKPSRFGDLFEVQKSADIQNYVEEVSHLSSESAKTQRFLLLLKDIFGDVNTKFVEDYLRGVEKYVKSKGKDIVLKGRVDNLYGNLVIEFERDLGKTLSEAKEQLKRYIACLWSEEEERKINYLCMAADGINFQVFSPGAEKPLTEPLLPEDIVLEKVDELILPTPEPYQAYFWLDRYFFRERILPPRTEEFEQDFGMHSPAFLFSFRLLKEALKQVESRSDFQVIYENWERYLRVTYGSIIGSKDLFLRHTYLATLAKLIAWARLTAKSSIPSSEEISSILNGEFFRGQRIANFLEEDFFSWIAREKVRAVGFDISKKLLSLLLRYNLKELFEDVLKALYQELVDPEARHDLGEYYTPDWLAHRMVEKALEENPRFSVLDPACGSGTFLYMTIKYKRDILGDSRETLEHILENVVGIDIHPLAVIISKTNYLLALGDLFKRRRKSIALPIYLADSIKLPQMEGQMEMGAPLPGFKLEIDGKRIIIPEVLTHDPRLYDEAIEASKEFARNFAGKKGGDRSTFLNFIVKASPKMAADKALFLALYDLAVAMKELIEERRDSIWAFILKNLYKPLFLKGNFDVVLGNPPWLSYRYVEKGEYQKFLKRQIVEDYRLLSGKAELITHMELATLFFLRTADLYLRKGGTIGFLLPRSVFSSDQHYNFRRSYFSLDLGFEEIWDLEEVEPLFNVPACVFFGKRGIETEHPLKCQVFSGKLERKNSSLREAQQALAITLEELFVTQVGKRSFLSSLKVKPTTGLRSFYQPYFKQGATIVPRSLWFVDVKSHPVFGFDPSLPYVSTTERAQKEAKTAYKGLRLEGNIEGDFLYATLLSTDIVPFGRLDFRLVVLPLLPSGKHFKILSADEARSQGFLNLANWLERAQGEWGKRRGEKAERMNVQEWLDYRKKLSTQNRLAKYKVLYPTSATYLCSCVVEDKHVSFEVEGQSIEIQGFVAESKEYYFDTDDKEEAYYLATVLNSPIVDELLKPMQSRGLWGPRDIHKKVLEIPIPQYNSSDENHRALSQLGEQCTRKVEQLLPQLAKSRSIGHTRRLIKAELKKELGQIDALVKQIMGS